MPEGPSIVILKEAIDSFRGKKFLRQMATEKVSIMGGFTAPKSRDSPRLPATLLIPNMTDKLHSLTSLSRCLMLQ